jgi:hypothetical protein
MVEEQRNRSRRGTVTSTQDDTDGTRLAALLDDPVLAAAVQTATVDAEMIGIILGGSRGAGRGDAAADYDLLCVLSDDAYDRRRRRGAPAHWKGSVRPESGRPDDLGETCPRELAAAAANPGWWSYGHAHSQVLLDKTGEVARLMATIAVVPEARAQAETAAWFDAYLNAFYRSIKAWRRGDELGGRLHAADSVHYLAKALFYLQRRWPPYHDYLSDELPTLSIQGWPTGMVAATCLQLLRTGDPALQQQLASRVESLMRSHGHGGVVDAWGGDIARAQAHQFPGS